MRARSCSAWGSSGRPERPRPHGRCRGMLVRTQRLPPRSAVISIHGRRSPSSLRPDEVSPLGCLTHRPSRSSTEAPMAAASGTPATSRLPSPGPPATSRLPSPLSLPSLHRPRLHPYFSRTPPTPPPPPSPISFHRLSPPHNPPALPPCPALPPPPAPPPSAKTNIYR